MYNPELIPQENFITPQVLIIYLNFLETIHHISLLQTSVGFRQETISVGGIQEGGASEEGIYI